MRNPEQETQVEPEVAQVYESTRDEMLQILYVDDQIILLRSDEERRNGGNSHIIERRTHFDNRVEAGFYEHRPDSDLDMVSFSGVEWEQVAYIGEKTAALPEAGYQTALDVQQADDDELLSVDGLGKAALG